MKIIISTILLFLELNIIAVVYDDIPAIYIEKNADRLELFAAREIRKYVYQRTGNLLPIVECAGNTSFVSNSIIVGRLVKSIKSFEDHPFPAMDSDAYVIKTIKNLNGKRLIIAGGSTLGTLYAAYRFAETMGIGFYLEGDAIPDKQIPFTLPVLDIMEKPLFSLRGILPFHDFPEGPDWWNEDDYKAIFTQLVKMRMNFIGLHTYPEGGVGPEPLVWIGPPWNIKSDGTVKSSYQSSYFTTSDGDPNGWGYEPMSTGEYYFGASQLFENDFFGADYMMDLGCNPRSFTQQNALFDRFGHLLADIFTYARNLGINTCIGTEAPLTIPRSVCDHLKTMGKNPKDTATIKEIYEGIFERIKATHPLDYYWIWTPEELMTDFPDEKLDPIINDLKLATEAAHAINAPFRLATCGWTLGPPKDRAMFDKILPKDVAISCISLIGGKEPLQYGFAEVDNREKWAIPWFEDDSRLTVPQLWVGRMRKDAADAYAYRCTGLMGIHWRTRIINPNVSALAKAAWDQHGWNPDLPNQAKVLDHSKDTIRDLPVKDFYTEWANINFGEEVADKIAYLFIQLDGITNLKEKKDKLPKPAFWEWGPGGIRPDYRPWSMAIKDYQFVSEMEALHSQIKGPGNQERYEYWLNQFRYIRAMGQFNCTWGQYKMKLNRVIELKNSNEQLRLATDSLLPLRITMAEIMGDIQRYLTESASTNAELGVLCNWQQHIFPKVFRDPDLILEKLIDSMLPDNARLQKDYNGVPHIIVATNRGSLEEGESLEVKIRTITADNAKPTSLKVFWKKPGDMVFHSKDLQHLSRGVYELKLTPYEFQNEEFEYYVEIRFGNGDVKRFPASAPGIYQYITLIPVK